ncbi:MAG: hypothetical protein N3B16_08565 [Candidatus Aminicenantes bacterium]|nr:hypothetical protein [Candidatus Aminicenantes bacterium]
MKKVDRFIIELEKFAPQPKVKERLKKKYHLKDGFIILLNLLIVSESSSYNKNLNKKTSRLNRLIYQDVFFGSDHLVYPSPIETSMITFFEAQAFGLPVFRKNIWATNPRFYTQMREETRHHLFKIIFHQKYPWGKYQ